MLASIHRNSFGGTRRAQGMTEYIIIVALIAVALITIVTMFGNKIKWLFTASVESLDKSKVTNPKSIEDPSVKDEIDSNATIKDQDKAHTLKQFRSGE